jgi:hypothetical protein
VLRAIFVDHEQARNSMLCRKKNYFCALIGAWNNWANGFYKISNLIEIIEEISLYPLFYRIHGGDWVKFDWN